MKIAYIAHALGAPTPEEMQANRDNASVWVAWIAEHFDVAPIATWITLSSQWAETPVNREIGLEIDCALIRRCDEIWLVGERMSDGMRIELAAAREAGLAVIDLTNLWRLPPVNLSARMAVMAVRKIVEKARAT